MPRLLTLLISTFCFQLSAFSAQQPNIIYVLADDMGYGDATCYNAKSKIPTPHLDQLASEGIRFTDGHSPAAICTPTRYSNLTGRYYWRTTAYKNLGWRVVTPWTKPLIGENEATLPSVLKKAGYRTACIGKWHLGFDWAPPTAGKASGNYKHLDHSKPVNGGPITRGFDYFFGIDSPNASYAFIENDRFTEIPSEKPTHAYAKSKTLLQAKGWTFEGLLPTFTHEAVDFISNHAKQDKPFFLYLPLNGPHTPIAPSKDFVGKTTIGPYGDFTHQIDHSLGQVMQAVEKADIADNTIIIFSSDNGSPSRDGSNYFGAVGSILSTGHNPNQPFRGYKADLWEAGHRVPFVIKWPGLTQPNTVSNQLVSQIDLFRTITSHLNIPLPKNAAPDSIDITPALKGDASPRTHLVTYDEYLAAIRQDNWKLILARGATGFSRHAPGGYKPPKNAPVYQLYNLANAPNEKNNLYGKHPETTKQLITLLQQISAPLPDEATGPDSLHFNTAQAQLSWKLPNNTTQGTYRICIASTPEKLAEGKPDIWDSRTIRSAKTTIPYSGPTLKPAQTYFCQITLHDAQGTLLPKSPITRFLTPAQ